MDEKKIEDFFLDRAKRHDESRPEVTILYQDKNPQLAEERDKYEKDKMLPLFQLNNNSKILDLGCGIGRWADTLHKGVVTYLGTDFSAELIEIATKRHKDHKNVFFQTLRAEDLANASLAVPAPFDLVIVAGLLLYLNDSAAEKVLQAISKVTKSGSIIYIRNPIGINERLTLDNIWSEELEHEYSAIYRTHLEHIALLDNTLGQYQLLEDHALYPNELNNRADTIQHIFLIQRI